MKALNNGAFRKKDNRLVENADLENDKSTMKWNIYHGKERGKEFKAMNRFHFWFKTKLLLPFLFIGRKFIGNKYEEKILNDNHNLNLKIFNEAFDQTLYEWNYFYRCYTSQALKQKGVDIDLQAHYDHVNNDSSSNALRDIKALFMKGILMDAAYREFFNILMHNISRSMTEEYKGKKVSHLFYTAHDIYDVDYKVYWDNNGKKQLISVGSTNES